MEKRYIHPQPSGANIQLGGLATGDFFKLKRIHKDSYTWEIFLVVKNNEVDSVAVVHTLNNEFKKLPGFMLAFSHEPTKEERLKAIPYTA